MKMRKVISIVLALCMAVSLLPTVAFASADSTESTVSIVADFTKTPKEEGLHFRLLLRMDFR